MHPDAAVRGGASDRPLLARPVNADPVAERDEPLAQRVARVAGWEGLALVRIRPRPVRCGPRGIAVLVKNVAQSGRRLETRGTNGYGIRAHQTQRAEDAQRVRG